MQNAEKQANLPLDAKEAARVLKMDSRTLVCWARRGYVPAHPLGEGKRRIWRFFESELLEWVENHENGCVRKPPESMIAHGRLCVRSPESPLAELETNIRMSIEPATFHSIKPRRL